MRTGLFSYIVNSSSLAAILLLSGVMFWASCGQVLVPQGEDTPSGSPLQINSTGSTGLSLMAGLIPLTVMGPIKAYDLTSREITPSHTFRRLQSAGWQPGALNIAVVQAPLLETCPAGDTRVHKLEHALTASDIRQFAGFGVNIFAPSPASTASCPSQPTSASKPQSDANAVWAQLNSPENNLLVHGVNQPTHGKLTEDFKPTLKEVALANGSKMTLLFSSLDPSQLRARSRCLQEPCDEEFRAAAARIRETTADLKVVTLFEESASELARAQDIIRHAAADLVIISTSEPKPAGSRPQWHRVRRAGQTSWGIIISGLASMNDPTHSAQWFSTDYDLNTRQFLDPRLSGK